MNLRGEVVGINTAIISEAVPATSASASRCRSMSCASCCLSFVPARSRGRIGVGIGPVPADAVDEFGLKDRNGAVVLNVAPGGGGEGWPRTRRRSHRLQRQADSQPRRARGHGDCDQARHTVPAADHPRSTGAVAQRDRRRARPRSRKRDGSADNGSGGGGPQETTSGFGITLGNITPELAQRLRLNRNASGAVILNVEPGSTAARAGLSEGDVIVRVGRENVSNAVDASRELGRVPQAAQRSFASSATAARKRSSRWRRNRTSRLQFPGLRASPP